MRCDTKTLADVRPAAAAAERLAVVHTTSSDQQTLQHVDYCQMTAVTCVPAVDMSSP